MTNEQINRAVAEELGWKHNGHGAWHKDGQVRGLVAEDLEEFGYVEALPNYAGDYTAAAEMRKGIKEEERFRFTSSLIRSTVPRQRIIELDYQPFEIIDATPRQQCEAFLRMRGKWVE